MTALLAVAGLAGLSACGGGGSYHNGARPPAPIAISAAIHDDRVQASPTSFGAGPVTILISNQSHAAQRVTFETQDVGAASPGGITESTEDIRPLGTATLQVDVKDPGTYSLHVRSRAIRPAQLQVGRPRRSSQDDLLLP